MNIPEIADEIERGLAGAVILPVVDDEMPLQFSIHMNDYALEMANPTERYIRPSVDVLADKIKAAGWTRRSQVRGSRQEPAWRDSCGLVFKVFGE